MKLSIKKCLSTALAAAALVLCMPVTSASASYIDGDREVDYYDFDLSSKNDDDILMSMADPIVRQHKRNWVVSVNDVSYTKYAISYGVHGDDMSVGIAKVARLRGTGNTGAAYNSNTPTGIEVRLAGSISHNEPDENCFGAYSSGQWSPDAPY